MNLKEEMKRHDRPMEYDVFGKIIVENAVPTTIAIDVAESYAKEKAWEWYNKGRLDSVENQALTKDGFLKEWDDIKSKEAK